MNITFKWGNGVGNGVSYLSLGYLFIEKNGVFMSNHDRTPNQACMLFPSISLLMDKLHDLEMQDSSKERFQAVGANFELDLSSSDGEELTIYDGKQTIHTELGTMAKALWKAYIGLLESEGVSSAKEIDMADDLYLSALHFEVTFAYALKELE